MESLWKDVVGYEGLYKISNTGELIGERYGKEWMMSLRKNYKGYLCTSLTKNGNRKHMLVHRIVADAFIPNTHNKPQVNHKNGIKTDNRISNLEWCTASENCIHAHRTLGVIVRTNLGKFGKDNHCSKKINQYTLNGVFIKQRYGFREIQRELGFIY